MIWILFLFSTSKIRKNLNKKLLKNNFDLIGLHHFQAIGWKNMTWESVDELNRALYTFEITDKKSISTLIATATIISQSGTVINEPTSSHNAEFGINWRGSGYLLMNGYERYESLSQMIGDKNILRGANYVSTYYPWTSAIFYMRLCLGHSHPPTGPFMCLIGDENDPFFHKRKELNRVYGILISLL